MYTDASMKFNPNCASGEEFMSCGLYGGSPVPITKYFNVDTAALWNISGIGFVPGYTDSTVTGWPTSVEVYIDG